MQWMKHNLEIFGYNLIQLSFSDFVCNHNQTALKDLHAEQEVLFSKSLFCLGFLYETIAVTHQYWLLPSEVIYVMLSWNQLEVCPEGKCEADTPTSAQSPHSLSDDEIYVIQSRLMGKKAKTHLSISFWNLKCFTLHNDITFPSVYLIIWPVALV